MTTDEITATTLADDEAREAALIEAANDATDAYNNAVLDAQAWAHTLRDNQWIATSAAEDITVWECIVEATESLPADATHQQIAVAQARSVLDAKKLVVTNASAAAQDARAFALQAAVDLEEKRATAVAARAAVHPQKLTSTMALLAGGWGAAMLGMFKVK